MNIEGSYLIRASDTKKDSFALSVKARKSAKMKKLKTKQVFPYFMLYFYFCQVFDQRENKFIYKHYHIKTTDGLFFITARFYFL